MEIQKKGNTITIKKVLSKNEMWKFSKGRCFESISFYRKPIVTSGFSNSCDSGKFILMIDYDEIYREIVIEEFERLQKDFRLTAAYLFTTKDEVEDNKHRGNYHIVCLTALTMGEVYKILKETHCDINYTSMPRRNPYKNWVLRLSGKGKRSRPKFVKMVGDIKGNLTEEVSTAHKKLLTKLYSKIKHPKYENEDNGKKVGLQKYQTK